MVGVVARFGLCKTHPMESSPLLFVAQCVGRCGLWQGGMCLGSKAKEPAIQAGTWNVETHLFNEPLGLEALDAVGVFPLRFISDLALYFQADANKWKNR